MAGGTFGRRAASGFAGCRKESCEIGRGTSELESVVFQSRRPAPSKYARIACSNADNKKSVEVVEAENLLKGDISRGCLA